VQRPGLWLLRVAAQAMKATTGWPPYPNTVMPVCAGILLGLVVVMILQAACTLDQMMLW
jgi:ABC-type uncharacterized transport system permease subunit